jgi:TrmH family RNA methyltransferase
LKHITSGANALVKRARKLLRKKARDTDGAFLIEGFILIGEAARSGIVIECVFLRGDDADGEMERLLETIPALAPARAEGARDGEPSSTGVDVISLSEDVFDGIADTVTPKSMVAVAKKPRYPIAIRGDALLVLDRLQDPGNVGALIRTAGAIGFDGALCVKGTADPFSPKAVRASAGALFRLPVYEAGEPEEAVETLRSEGYRIALLDAGGASLCWEADITGRTAFVVGNEGGGAAVCFLDSADVTISVPMTEGAESLNAAVAAGIAMYERRRQMSAFEDRLGDAPGRYPRSTRAEDR